MMLQGSVAPHNSALEPTARLRLAAAQRPYRYPDLSLD